MKKIVALLCIASCLLITTGCRQTKTESATTAATTATTTVPATAEHPAELVGTWVYDTVTMEWLDTVSAATKQKTKEGFAKTYKDLTDEAQWLEVYGKSRVEYYERYGYRYALNADGTGETGFAGEHIAMTWKLCGEKLILSANSATVELDYKDGILSTTGPDESLGLSVYATLKKKE